MLRGSEVITTVELWIIVSAIVLVVGLIAYMILDQEGKLRWIKRL